MLNFYGLQIATQLAGGFLGPESPGRALPERPLRISGAELQLAMLLHRHQDLLATLLPERLPHLGRRARIAVSLSEPAPCAHVLLFGDGSFSACLSADAPIEDTLVPFSLLGQALLHADARLPDQALLDAQLRALPPGTLLHALQRGPGHVTREMVDVIDMRPQTFVLPTALVFWRSVLVHHRLYQQARGHNPKRGVERPVWQQMTRADARVRICLALLSRMQDPRVRATLGGLYAHLNPWTKQLMMALTGQEGGGVYLMKVAVDPGAEPACQQLAVQGLVLHALLYPEQGRPLCEQLLLHPSAQLTPTVRAQVEAFTSLPIEALQEQAASAQPIEFEGEDMPGVPGSARAGRQLPGQLGRSFPPAAAAEQVQREWTAYLQRPARRRAQQPVVHSGPRIGRNDPCCCGSGRKYKQCCLGKEEERTKAEST